MAGYGPPPAEQKRRRNKPPEFDELPAEGHLGEYPPLPATYGIQVFVRELGDDGKPLLDEQGQLRPQVAKRKQVKYLHDTREWYETWAHSPMATKFAAVDWNRLRRVAVLIDSYFRSPSKELAAELRLQEALFGGTPVDRLRARMRIAAPEITQAAPAATKSASSRRSRLSIVK